MFVQLFFTACYPKYLLRCLITFLRLYAFFKPSIWWWWCCCCRCLVSSRWCTSAYQGKMIFRISKCRVSMEALQTNNGSVNHDAKVKCLFACDIGLVGHDSLAFLCTEPHLISMQFFFLCFSFSFKSHLHDLLCHWIMCNQRRYMWAWQLNKTRTHCHTVHCSMNFNFGEEEMTFWYFERQWKTARYAAQFFVLSENAG